MIAAQFESVSAQEGDRPAVREPRRTFTYQELSDAGVRLARRFEHLAGQRVGMAIDAFPLQLAALVALDRLDATPVIFPRSAGGDLVKTAGPMLHLAQTLSDRDESEEGLEAVFDEPPLERREPARASQGRLVMFTSGTSGPPKPVEHRWESIAAAVRRDAPFQARRWLLTYAPDTFAGMQVWLQALLTAGTLSIAPAGEPRVIAATIVGDAIEFASGTPTFWRLLLGATSHDDFAGARLEQITLGGEAVDQPILDALRAAFPRARICHIYASTEMGACFSVVDGQAGFPARLLDHPPPTCRLRIASDGELEIQSSRAMLGYEGETPVGPWFATGDLVERREDRIYFAGRKSGSINVGGSKVYPEEVEAVIRRVAGVRDVRVRGMKSSLVGQLVEAEVQPDATADVGALRASILAACRAQLAKHKVPATIHFAEMLQHTGSGKLSRTTD